MSSLTPALSPSDGAREGKGQKTENRKQTAVNGEIMKSGNQEAVKTDRAVSRQRTFAMEHYLPVTMERQVGERLMRHIKPRGIKRLWAVTEAVREWLDRQGAEK